MTSARAELQDLSDRAVAHVLRTHGTGAGRRSGWLMISTILIEAWDLYSISFILVFLKAQYNPGWLLLGLTSAAVQAGAVVGALSGGWLADKFGRRPVFLTTMAAFVVLALAQSFVPNLWWLVGVRFLLGIPLGSDIATAYTYIMESMPRSKREVMGSRWQGMFGIGEVLAIIVVTIMYVSGMDHELLWRIALGLGALPALALLLGRLGIPDTPLSLIQRGRFAQAKKVSMEMFGDPLDMLPGTDHDLPRPRTRDFLADLWSDHTRRRATIFAWISNAMQGAEFATFAFYLPVIFVVAGVSGIRDTNFLSAAIYTVATISGFVGPAILPRIGHKRLSMWGFGTAFAGLCAAALFLGVGWNAVVPLAAAVLLWGHYWAASNGMTVASMMAPTRYKATASGFAYLFVKIPLFFTIFLFPSLFDAWGVPLATLFAAVFSLIGWLGARFVLPEVHGYVESAAATE
ncbi:MFS transporter [Amycolatopsis pigmentata]|uniref:MFS transporter n=1 Tax=Amycolatopsis pigmentata TaxID=450801 RepID=A0ABW5FZS2_9PSEU